MNITTKFEVGQAVYVLLKKEETVYCKYCKQPHKEMKNIFEKGIIKEICIDQIGNIGYGICINRNLEKTYFYEIAVFASEEEAMQGVKRENERDKELEEFYNSLARGRKK